MLGVGDSHPPLATYRLNLFYHPFYPDVTNVQKDTRPSPAGALVDIYTKLIHMAIVKVTCMPENSHKFVAIVTE